MIAKPTIYIGGYSRSGSTLIGRILGEHPDAIYVGELCFLWRRALAQRSICTCGSPFESCPFWMEVGEKAFGGWQSVDVHALVRYEELACRTVYVPGFVGVAPLTIRRQASTYREHLEAVYEAVRSVSGARIVVDSSKQPSIAAMLQSSALAEDIRVLHLVRDSRAVAHSYTRAKAQPSPVGGETVMRTVGASRTTIRWVRWNMALEMTRRNGKLALIRYEDFVEQPASVLEKIATFCGEDYSAISSQLLDDALSLNVGHVFSANPMRAAAGRVPIALDDRWKSRLARKDKAIVSLISWPLLRRYRYPL